MRSVFSFGLVIASVIGGHSTATRPPNYYLGTCLDEEWVQDLEAQLDTSHTNRDPSGRLVNPFLQTGLQFPRYSVR